MGDCPGRPDQALIHVTVGFTMAAVFGILAAMYGHAYRHRGDLDLSPVEVVDTRIDVYRNLAIGGIGLISVVTAAVLSRIAPHLIGLAGYVYFLIGIAEWALGDYNGRLRRRVAANTTDTSPA